MALLIITSCIVAFYIYISLIRHIISILIMGFKKSHDAFMLVSLITASRFVIAIACIITAFLNHPVIFRWMLLYCFFTDALDGLLARYLQVKTCFGARMDSLADDITIVSALVGIVLWFRPFLLIHAASFFVMVSLFLLQLFLSLLKYGKTTSFHTYGAKTAAVFQAAFILLLFFYQPIMPIFYCMYALTALELMEEIIILLVLPKAMENVKGLWWINKGLKL